MSALNSAVEPKSTRPSEQAVDNQMNNWLRMVYEYFALENAERGSYPTHHEIMARVTNYLNSIQDKLKTSFSGQNEANHGAVCLAAVSGLNKQISTSANRSATTATQKDVCEDCEEEIGDRRYGLLKSCSHKFCEPCIRDQLNQVPRSGNPLVDKLECITCGHLSDSVVFTNAFHPSGSREKTRLFDSMVCLNNHRQMVIPGRSTRVPINRRIFREDRH